jgi:hypothetical protein
MGTRSSVIIFQDGKAKGYYNQYDGYPEGLGTDIIKELKKVDKAKGWDVFKANCKKVKLVDENKKPSAAIQKKYVENGFYNEKVGSQSTEDWYSLLRECQGAAYIPAIMDGKVQHMCDGTNFVQSSLFCEYAYVIDLDKMVVEFYRGFQKKPQPGNRFGTNVDDGYYPCAKIGQIALDGISKDSRALDIMIELYEIAAQERELERQNR